MSNFRRGPNVSQYIANLNTVSPQDTTSTDDFLNTNLSGDLGPFLTTEFFDFDMGDSTLDNFGAPPVDTLNFEQPQVQQGHDFLSENFDFTNFPDLSIPLDTDLHSLPQLPQQHFSSLPGPPIRGQIIPFPQETSMPRPQTIVEKPAAVCEKRAASEMSTSAFEGSATATDPLEPQDENARVAAEEDKRRRNTAASARFRVKKKQREADLEKRAKEMTEKASVLETKVQQLEMENRWLKSLITEKDVSMQNFGDLYKAFVAKENEAREAARVEGVGTGGGKRMKLERA